MNLLANYRLVALAAAIPDTVAVILWVVLGLAALYFFMTVLAAHIVYDIILKRRSKKQWGRHCSSPTKENLEMYDEGMVWQAAHDDAKTELHMVNEGLNLYAEFYDAKSDKAVIVLPGRTESLHYAYYFAKPYWDAGWSILAIDQRAHGNSDGKYNSLGFNECRDVIEWSKLIHEKFGVNTIVLHGICIGSSCGIYTLTNEKCPDYVKGLVGDGMYQKFIYSFRTHMKEDKKSKTFPAIPFIDMWMRIHTHSTMRKGPIDVIGKYDKPLLMIHGTADKYSTPERAQELFDLCPSKRKKLVWFDGGQHSMLRWLDSEKYDSTVTAFLAENFADEKVNV